ncbi:MAG: CARDB domain-containing protein [Candidatus Buchananbacteria bacterium]
MNKSIYLLIFASALFFAGSAKAAVYSPMAGDLVKIAANTAVYIIDDNLKRHLFSNAVTFWSWHTGTWADQKIKTITQTEFDSFDADTNVKVRAGSNLIQFDNSNKIYAVTPGGVLCETRALYGADFMTRVVKIQSAFETDYIKDNACIVASDGKYPDGSLIQYAKSIDIWLIDGGKKRRVSAEGFKANGYKDSSLLKNVPVSMVYVADNRSISAIDYNLGILYSLNYSRAVDITSRPDFIISDIIFPTARIIVNTTADIKLIIKNTGGNLTSDLGLKNIIFTGQDWTTASVAHASYPTTINPLKTGQTFEVTYTGKFVASGEKNFTAKVNEPSEITEINSINNSYAEKITVYAQ